MSLPAGRRLWLVGCGNMGGAMLARWIATATLAPEQVTVIDPGTPRLPDGVRHVSTMPDEQADVVLLAVKPQMLGQVADAVRAARPALLISILAGVETAALARATGAAVVVRAMPNLPVALGQGVVALFGDDGARATVDALMAPLGMAEWVADEAAFHAVTALSGSGPGFVYRFVDALAAAGAAQGLPAPQALRFALATVSGAAALAQADGASPATLADRVASPGGTTRAGLDVLDAGDALRDLIARTIAAAATRSAELAEAGAVVDPGSADGKGFRRA